MATRLALLLACVPLLVVAQDASSAEVQELSTSNADFATRLYRRVASASDGNVLLSPLTASLSLAALMSGAEGTTREQLLEGLSLKSLDPLRIPDLYENLWRSVNQSGSLSQAFSIVVGQQFNIAADFRGIVDGKYGGSVQSLDFSDTQAAQNAINQLTQRLSANQGKNVRPVSAQTQMMLINAAFFQAPFVLAFNQNYTQEERFYVDKYRVVQVPMMFHSDKYHLAYDSALKVGVLKLPMQGGAAMLVLLPDEDVDCTSVEEEMSADRFRGWLRQLKRTKLEVQLPRFSLEQSYSLEKILPSTGLGISEVFKDTADLSGITGEKTSGLKLSEFVHNVGVAIDERSNGARGSTFNIFSSLPPRLTFNRPFLFLIYHEPTSNLLLMGRVVDPTKKM